MVNRLINLAEGCNCLCESLRLLTPSSGQLPDATADRRSTMSRLHNNPARFAEEVAEGFVSTALDEAIAIQLSTVAS